GEHVIGAQQHSNGVTEHRDVGLDWRAVYGAQLDEPRAFGHAASPPVSAGGVAFTNSAAPARTSAQAWSAGRFSRSPIRLSRASPSGSSTPSGNSTFGLIISTWRSPSPGGSALSSGRFGRRGGAGSGSAGGGWASA